MAIRLKIPVKPDTVESVSQFVGAIMGWTREGQKPVAFRGQAYHGWPTLPKVFRPDEGIYDHEKEAIRDLISLHPQEFSQDESMFDRLVRMQHFGLPTRLLDVTTNPLVALYFACSTFIKDDKEQDGKVQALFLPNERQKYFDSDRVRCMANLANLTVDEKKEISKGYGLSKEAFRDNEGQKRLLWFVRIERTHFTNDVEPSDLVRPVYVKPKMSNRRIIAQSGSFIIYGARRLRSRELDNDLRLQRLTVPAGLKKDLLSQLERLGIHSSSLFPEIEKAAEYISERFSKAR